MEFKKVAFGLMVGGAVGLGAVACDDSTTTPPGGDADVVPTCSLASDGDSMTATFNVTHLGTPKAPAGMTQAVPGFNLDGINNSATTLGGVGRNVAGCGVDDYAGGVDNSLTRIAGSLSATGVNIDMALQEAVDDPTSGLNIQIILSKWNGQASDPCVGVAVGVSTGAAAPVQVAMTSGVLTNGSLRVSFPDTVSFSINISAMGGMGVLDLDLYGGNMLLKVQGTGANATLGAGSLLGGFLFWEPGQGDDATAYASVDKFKVAVESLVAMLGLEPDVQATAVSAFAGARDLHMEPNGSVTPCTGANQASTNRNAVSVALAIDSL